MARAEMIPGDTPSNLVEGQLVRLRDLPDLPCDTKVRFLGCVMRYDVETGILYVDEARYDENDPITNKKIIAGVDISLIDDSKAEKLLTGTWLNIIGYIDNLRHKPVIKERAEGDKVYHGVRIRAQALWHTGPMAIDEYFSVLELRKACSI